MLVCFTPADNPPFAGVAFNRLAAWATGGPYCHCEVAFRNVKISSLQLLHQNLSKSLGNIENPTSKRFQGYVRAREALDRVFTFFPPNIPPKHNIEFLAFHALQGSPLDVRVLSQYFEEPFYQPYNEKWKVYEFSDASDLVKQGQLLWCLGKVGLPYNTLGALWSPMAADSKDIELDPDSWWCSNHALRFLQNIALCQQMSLRNCTPNSLAVGFEKAYINFNGKPSEGERVDFCLGEDHWRSIEAFHPYVSQQVGQ